ncbi:MAG: hypothetical protein ACK5IJ_07025 [Mangrovibacterium sp.]
MKKLFLIAVLAVAAISSSFAQEGFYVGGSLGFNTTENLTSFNISPEVGKVVSEKLWVGAKVGFSFSNEEVGSLETKTTSFGLTPYARYYMLRLNKFAIAAQGELSYWMNSTKVGDADSSSISSFGFNVYPYLTYDLTDRVVLQTRINGFNFGINSTDSNTSFGFGASSNNIVDLDAISIGVLVKL